VPMLRGGDELSHTQHGNNNAYCQDNEISWLNWELDERRQEFLEFCQKAIQIWREHPVLKRRKFFHGRPIRGSGAKDLAWLLPDGSEVTDVDWNSEAVNCMGMRLNGEMVDEFDERGRRIIGETLLVVLNARNISVRFAMPTHKPHERWAPILDSAEVRPKSVWLSMGECYELQPQSLTVLQLKRGWARLRNLLHASHQAPNQSHSSGETA
jgi:isoamylase